MIRRTALGLAVAATGTALSMSTLAGWQRGGWLPERLVWVAAGVVLVASAHLLPALARSAPVAARVAGAMLWAACMATACYGHVTFFLQAQRHAGELRAASVPDIPIQSHRALAAVMADRVTVVTRLAATRARSCRRDCAVLDGQRSVLAARLDALEAEAADVRQSRVEAARVTAQRRIVAIDPVAARLAALAGTTASAVELAAGLVFAIVLECLACLLWWLALNDPPLKTAVAAVAQPVASAVTLSVAPPVMQPVTNGHEPVTPGKHESSAPPEDDLTRLSREVAAGRVRATVADIRRHLGCSQAKAAALRRQLTQPAA